MNKRALIVGINYVGSGYDLRGCINDANNMKLLLEGRGFQDIVMLTEAAATTNNIKTELVNLATGNKPGDVIVFHYSGHGSQLPSTTEDDGYEEIICPYDLDWRTKVITDDFLKATFNAVPNGVNVTVILDCCNSGDGLDTGLPEDWTVPVTANTTNPEGSAVVSTPDGLTVTTTTTNGTTTTIYSSKFLPPPADIAAITTDRSAVDYVTSRDVNATAMLVAACKSYQTSADAFINGSYQGAATYSILKAVTEDPTLSYRTLVTKMQEFMTANSFTQNPLLDGADFLKDDKFVEPWSSWTTVSTDPAPVEPVPIPTTPSINNLTETKKDNTLTIAVIAIILVVILLIIFA